jgi:putative component of toxin-antitoxin plasmid stabilization module
MNAEHLATIRQALGYYYWRKELELSEERTRVESALAALDTLVQGTWEPVPDGAYNDFVLDGNGKRIVMFINQEYGDDWCYLDKDMAICRRTTPQAAQDTTSTPPAVPDEVAETLDEALSTWSVDAVVMHVNGYVPNETLMECDARKEAALAWLDAHRRPVQEKR